VPRFRRQRARSPTSRWFVKHHETGPSATPRLITDRPGEQMLPNNNFPKRLKVFAGFERRVPLDRNAKVRLELLVRGLRMSGRVTRATVEVMHALMWHLHSSKSGRCHPTLQDIADMARCARSTVQEALKQLESARCVQWVNCLYRRAGAVFRTANAYVLLDPGARYTRKSSNTDEQSVDTCKNHFRSDIPLEAALSRLNAAMTAAEVEKIR
jgi:DNA-binding transcriptional regulator YhcF (GntR family)